MCGIHAVIARREPLPLSDTVRRRLCNRGPDHIGTTEARVASADGQDCFVALTSTVLSLRGDHVARQPFVDPHSGSVFCWNGEAWKVRHSDVAGNDGEAIASLLYSASQEGGAARQHAILKVLRSISGPFAFVYLDKPSGDVYFGRDRLGRRSLLLREDPVHDQLVLSSVAESRDSSWREVEADGVYILCLGTLPSERGLAGGISRVGWLEYDGDDTVLGIARFNRSLPQGKLALAPGSPSVTALREHLTASLRLRVLNIYAPPATAMEARVAILFSGGLDCTVLARLCHEVLPTDQAVDLINVAFENPRVASSMSKAARQDAASLGDCIYEVCPDRITGRKSCAELQEVCHCRTWRFVAVNVPYADYLSSREGVVSLMFPHNTEMDLSIACALFFAARGRGVLDTADPSGSFSEYKSTARVLLSGLGADELFGGYGRHAVAYSRQGYSGLIDELRLDVSRLGKRNLGRDDRIMSDAGVEVRFPYLDEELIAWAIGVPVWEKCDFENVEGDVEPGKRVLRLLALELGMAGVAGEKKRAIQFGARTAKMESGRVKGTAVIS